MWKSIAPSKVVIFGWRLLLDSLPLRAQLLRRNLIHSEEEACCPLCQQHCEACHHLFMSCVFAQSVWVCISSWLGVELDLSLSVEEFFHRCGQLCKGKKSKQTKHMFWLTTCWSIWLERNELSLKTRRRMWNRSVLNRIKCLTWTWCVY